MEKKFEKVLFILGMAERFIGALEEVSLQIKRFNDAVENACAEMKHLSGTLTGISEGLVKEKIKVSAEPIPEIIAEQKPEKIAPEKTKRPLPTKKEPQITDILYKAITAISKKKGEFSSSEVIDRVLKSADFKKESVRVAMQGFKVGSKAGEKTPEKYRDLIIPVEGRRGVYRLNPAKKS